MSESLHALKEKLNTSPSKRKANSVPATPSSPKGDLTDIRKCSMFCMTILKIEKKNIW
jgi:FERM domain-containing protein 3/5